MTAMHSVMVAVGEIRSSSDPHAVLTTCVGSCVAVAMYDRQSGVAGLLHAVLPQPVRTANEDRTSAYYAGPGVALLTQDLIQRGADPEKLTAVVVGGAALLASSLLDDAGQSIGAQNVRSAANMLHRAGIPFRAKDVGGHQGRRVALEVASGLVRVTETRRSVSASPSRVRDVPNDALLRLAAWFEELGPNATVAGDLLSLVHRPAVDWAGVRTVLARDPVLTLRLLRLSNSMSYGAPGEIASFEGALALLGPSQVRRLCVMAATARNAETTVADLRGLGASLRRHAHASALAIAVLTEELPVLVQQDAFAAGLLHAVGAAAVEHALRIGWARSASDAGELGALLLARWHFPERIVEAVLWSQCPVDEPTDLADVVHAGCAIAQLLGNACPLGPTALCVPLPSHARMDRIRHALSAAGLTKRTYSSFSGRSS